MLDYSLCSTERVRRRDFIETTSFSIIACFVIAFFFNQVAATQWFTGIPEYIGRGIRLFCFFYIARNWIGCAMGRLQDLGCSKLWIFIMAPVSLIFIAFLMMPLYAFPGNWVKWAIFLFLLSLPTLYLSFKDGQKHANKYGESPKYKNKMTKQYTVENINITITYRS